MSAEIRSTNDSRTACTVDAVALVARPCIWCTRRRGRECRAQIVATIGRTLDLHVECVIASFGADQNLWLECGR